MAIHNKCPETLTFQNFSQLSDAMGWAHQVTFFLNLFLLFYFCACLQLRFAPPADVWWDKRVEGALPCRCKTPFRDSITRVRLLPEAAARIDAAPL